MKVNFSEFMKDLAGEVISSNKAELTLRDVSESALLGTYQDESQLSGEEKAKRWILAMRIHADPKNADLTIEEVALVKKLIGKAYAPLIVGQTWQVLENSSKAKKDE